MTLSYGQSFSASEWDIISLKITNQISEIKMMRSNAQADSITIANLYATVASMQKAIDESDKANAELRRALDDGQKIKTISDQEIKRLKKDLRKQKVAKFIGWGAAAVILFFAVN